MQHRNARLTPNGRYQMVRLVEERGFTFEAAAAASNVSKGDVRGGAARRASRGERG